MTTEEKNAEHFLSDHTCPMCGRASDGSCSGLPLYMTASIILILLGVMLFFYVRYVIAQREGAACMSIFRSGKEQLAAEDLGGQSE